MPWSSKDAHKYKKGLTEKQAKKWAEIANSVYKQCRKDNGKDCAAKAVRVANSKVGESKNHGGENVSTTTKKIPKKGMYFTEDVDIKLSGGEEGEELAFSMNAYSGKILKGHWLWGDLAIDVQGVQFDKKRIPILEQHDLDRKIGVSNSKPKTDDNTILFESIKLLSNDTAQEFKKNLDDGFPYQASVGLRPLLLEEVAEGETAEVNGLKMKGPGTIFRKSKFKEASVCVFGFDENTGVSSLSDAEEEVEVDVILSDDSNNDNQEVEDMTLEQLKEQHPNLYKEIMDKFTEKDNKITELSGQVTTLTKERDDLKGETQNLSDSVKQYEDRVKNLEKAESLRQAKELKMQADQIVNNKLAEHKIPARLHDKIRKHIDHNEFVDENSAFDTEKFTEQAEAEIKEWSETLSEVSNSNQTVLGFGGGDRKSQNQELDEESTRVANELLAFVGVKEGKEE
jgi:hypothetical protein